MNRSRILALAIVLAALVVVVVLALRHRRSAESTGAARTTDASVSSADTALVTPSRAGDAARTVLPAAAESIVTEPVAKPASLRVRSAAGLALKFFEVEDEPGRWRDVALAEGACDPATLRLPCRVRAPGHVVGMALRPEEEVVLEADALLVLDGPNLRDCLLTIQFFAQYGPANLAGFDRVATFGYTSSDRWAVAVSGAGTVESLGYRQQVDVALTDRTHRLIQVEFQSTPGARGNWTVPCDARLPVAPLELAIARPADALRGELVCNLHIYGERDALREIPQSWGLVVLQPGLRFRREGRVTASENRWHVADVPLREHAVLTVMDEETHASGRLFFVHDGTPRRIELRSGFVLTGRIAVPAGTALPARMRMCFGRPDASALRDGAIEPFSSDLHDVPISTDGAFEVRGPQRVPLWKEISAEPPVELALRIEATGFDMHASRWPLGEATRVDCGTLLLVPLYAPIVLAKGHGFTGEDLHWKSMHTGTGENEWTVRCGRMEPDGSLSLVFDDDWIARHDPDSTDSVVAATQAREARAKLPVTDSVPALVLDINGDWGRAFVRGADGRYERVEEREYTIEVAGPAVVEPDSKLTLGWQWRGIPQRLTTLGPGRAGQRNTLRFTAPRDGVRLWWSSTPAVNGGTAGQDAKFVELASASATIEIP